MNRAQVWLAGARPKTLPAAVVPVAVGTAAVAEISFSAWRFVAALVVALSLQVATNYANDYSDGIRGVDDDRVGPLRLVGSGLASPGSVKKAIYASFGIAGLAGFALAATTTWWLLVVGAASIAAGWFYTGGPRPYGYAGLGEVFVFIFFGVVATVGSAFVQTESIDALTVWLSFAVGALATALLVVNNLRDRVGDASSGKRTLAVRIGDRASRWMYVGLLLGAVVGSAICAVVFERPGALLGLLGLLPAFQPLRAVVSGAQGRSLIAVLEATGKTQLMTGLSLTIGLLL